MMKKFLFIVALLTYISAQAFTIDPGYSSDNFVIMQISKDSVFQIMEEDSSIIAEENRGYYVHNWHMFIPVDGKRYIIKEAALSDLYNWSKINKENVKNRKKGLPVKEIYTYIEWIYNKNRVKSYGK